VPTQQFLPPHKFSDSSSGTSCVEAIKQKTLSRFGTILFAFYTTYPTYINCFRSYISAILRFIITQPIKLLSFPTQKFATQWSCFNERTKLKLVPALL